MSTIDPTFNFAPTSQVIEPADRPDQLAQGVIASLSRPRWGYRGRPWGLAKTIILSFLSFGLFPLLVWSWRFRNLMVAEQQQLWHLSEWLRLRTGREEATSLRNRSARLEPNNAYLFGPSIACLLLIPLLLDFHRGHLYRSEFDLHRMVVAFWTAPLLHNREVSAFLSFWALWTAFLFTGYFLHWLQVCRRCGQLKLFVERFNELAAVEGIAPVHVPSVGMGFSPLWTIAGVGGAAYGAIWALPLAFAGVVHARYVRVSSRQTRHALAQRVRAMLEKSRPAMNVPAHPCINEKCRGPLKQDAKFCTRCGARVV